MKNHLLEKIFYISKKLPLPVVPWVVVLLVAFPVELFVDENAFF
tara:strand:+ start:295 stop:426 length:132 start_codon:yes stop_codon:yes gene_type:complete